MTDPKPFPERPKYPPKTEQLDQAEWQTFSALPPPLPKIGIPQPEVSTPPKTSTQSQAAAVATGVKLATWQKRLGSFALDFGIGLGAAYLAQGVAALFGAGGGAVDMVGYGAFFAAWLANRGYLQSRPEGQSIGKWLLNIKTIDTETEQSPHVIRSVAREGVLSVLILTEALVVPLAADALFALFDKEKRQSLHDRAGRTQVVEAETGFHLDEKAVKLLQEMVQGEATADVKQALTDLLAQAKRNDTVADLSDQLERLRKEMDQNTRHLRQQSGKQAQTWVDAVKKKLDNE
ncbi:MAG: RDD family protein [Cyanobacteriota bacterium]|nr:RDD family protein [Cyanobacteriota bacterium]